jgi:hypothetical protein
LFSKTTHRIAILALLGLAFVAQGCADDTPTEVSLDDLTAQFKIQMGANTGDGGAAAASAGYRAPSAFEQEPSESQFTVLGPNLNVFSWPIIQDTPINAHWGSSIGETMYLSWPASAFPTNIWPDLDVAGGVRYGNTWVVYPAGGNPNNWVAQHTEWVRRPGEQSGTTFPFEEKLEAREPCLDCPIGQFVAGPSRHVTNQPEFRRRTAIKWFRYRDLSPWVWSEGGGGDDRAGDDETAPELQEVHVFIQKFTVKTENGTVITFNDVNRDIDLMTLRGQTIDVVDSEVPRGTFTDIEFNIDTTQSYVVVDGEQRTLNFATGTVVVEGPIIVGEAPITTVRLEFHIEDSVSENSNGTWTMAPVVVIAVTTS